MVESTTAHSIKLRLSAMLTAVCLMAYYSSMPVILGRAAASRHLEANELGLLAGLFAGGVAITAFLALFFVRKSSWKTLIRCGAIGAGVAFITPVYIDSLTILLIAHLVAGLFCGLGYSVAIAFLGDTKNPTRNYAFCFVLQALTGINISYFLPRLTSTENGFDIALILLSALAFFSIFFSFIFPHNNTKPASNTASKAPHCATLYILLALFVIFLVYAGDGSVWAFTEIIALSNGLTAETAGAIVGGSLLAGAIGSFMAGVIGTRFGYLKPMSISIGLSILSVVMLHYFHDLLSFTLAIFINGWAWNFGSGYRMGLVAALDTSGRFTPLITGMQLLGSSCGSIIAGLLVTEASFLWVFIFASVLWTISLLLFYWILKRQFKTLFIGQ